ncbi:MAG: hypothetical protein AAFQ84_02605, partial [Pseudomonadota bacterium]
QRRGDEFEQRRLERELRRALEDETRILEALLDAEVDDEDTLIASIRSIEDAIEDIERHTAIEGWETARPAPLIRRANAAVTLAERAIDDDPDNDPVP